MAVLQNSFSHSCWSVKVMLPVIEPLEQTLEIFHWCPFFTDHLLYLGSQCYEFNNIPTWQQLTHQLM